MNQSNQTIKTRLLGLAAAAAVGLGAVTSGQALDVAKEHMKEFMLKNTSEKDVDFMLGLSRLGPMTPDELPMTVVIPSFILSELRTAFQIGFILFIFFYSRS